MALTTNPLGKKMQLRSNHGMVGGKEKITARTYNDVRAAATDQDIYDVAQIIAGLQQPTLEEVIKHDLSLLLSV
ncbi:DUF1659 domain-containing protein [Acetobacterium bakii]|uniref:DUF1659 domain-containing protein n=1 Tax=Acetobacterium bakii TaxID=52689 RepID=A0A0L6TVD4_9FIRM|nr:DUF1659 domain-containing protein [Acetobacterium bakii]KNZ40231.1 hypothetical protein AKG39_18655 [Acetobacterium bakii]